MRHGSFLTLTWIAALVSLACSSTTDVGRVPTNPTAKPRTFRMGFAANPPVLTTDAVLRTIDEFTPRADAAIQHIGVPWQSLLAGRLPEDEVRSEKYPLALRYHQRGMIVLVTLDITNGIARDQEDPALVALHRSITEPAIQQLYRRYAAAIDTILRPEYLGLAAEVNLVRLAAPAAVYGAVRQMVHDAFGDARARNTAAKLYASIQADVAWGRIGSGAYVGVHADLADFPGMDVLALSSYPYLAGFAEPEDVPLDYYARLAREASLPVMVVEGGWSSDTGPGFGTTIVSSQAKQARWITRQAAILDSARAVAVIQLSYVDPDPSQFDSTILAAIAPFLTTGLARSDFSPKLARAVWDTVFARPRQ